MRRGIQIGAFSLVELLVSMAIIALAASLALPSLSRSMRNAKRVQCLNNQRQMGIAFQQFADLNHNKYPMQLEPLVSELAGASNAVGFFVLSQSPFLEVSRELVSPKLLTCAADRGRSVAETFDTLTVNQLSYVVSTNIRHGDARYAVATDRNVHVASSDPFMDQPGQRILFENSIHELRGNVLMGDGRVEWVGGFAWQPGVFSVPSEPPGETNQPVVAPTLAVQSVDQPSPERRSPLAGVGTGFAFGHPDGESSESATGESVTNQNTSPLAAPIPVVPEAVVGLLSPEQVVGPRGTNWWWLLLLLVLIGIYGLRRAMRSQRIHLRHPVELYTGAAINAEAMLATLAEHDIPARSEHLHEELLENETEMSRPLRIFVERERLSEANGLFFGETEE